MVNALSDADQLRNLLGEPIPEGGTESDTLFTSAMINDLLARHGSPDNACLEGWKVKAASLATMVDVADGDSKRSLSQAHTAAMKMVASLTIAPIEASPGTRIHRIVRGGFTG